MIQFKTHLISVFILLSYKIEYIFFFMEIYVTFMFSEMVSLKSLLFSTTSCIRMYMEKSNQVYFSYFTVFYFKNIFSH